MKRGTILFLLIYFFSCQPKETGVEEKTSTQKKSKYSQNELLLISAHDSLPIVDYDFSFPRDSGISYLYKITGDTSYEKDIWYGIVLNKKLPRVKVLYYRYDPRILHCWSSYRIDVLVNYQNQILIENEYVPKNSVSEKIKTHLASEYYLENVNFNSIVFLYDTESSIDELKSIIQLVIEGYFLRINEISYKLFKKRISDLNMLQLMEINKMLPFRFGFLYKENYPWMRPPPQIE